LVRFIIPETLIPLKIARVERELHSYIQDTFIFCLQATDEQVI